jgi:nitroimidazol reductase NimA-like FMN-containing flavoprotein (pyridoxamine 5'-phosphate oxidase superfamily)
MNTVTHSVDTLAPQELLDRLASARVGRLAFSHHALPALLAMNYIVDGRELVLQTAAGPAVGAAQGRGSIVAFEVDEIDPKSNSGWSVVVTGHLREVTERSRIERYARCPAFPRDARLRHFLVITPGLVSGRWFPLKAALEAATVSG